jgi:NADPH:quinone reductase-like Zn-dependent oxidoreductase
MRAVGLYQHLPIEKPDSLVDLDLPKPAPAGRDLLVCVEAVSVNPVDTKVRAPGKPARSSPLVLGWDAAGIVEAVGPEASLFKPGDHVFYAGDITRPGSRGVGSMAVQLAKIAGLTVLATASRPESIAWVKQLGADLVVDHRQPLKPQLEAAGNYVVDYILNCADTDAYWDSMAEVIAPQGKICTIVENKGPLNQQLMKLKSVTHVWELMFTRSKFQTADMIEQHKLLDRIAGWIDRGTLKGILRETLEPITAETLRKAHAMLESGMMIGKLVVKGW